jgi:hypothetical protein
MYANINNPANFQLQDFAQFGFRVITTDFIPVPGEQYRTLYVLQDAVVTATTQKGDDITSKAILAGTLLHGLFNSVSITSGRVLAYAAGRVTAEEIIALYEAYVVALGGTLENTQCAIDTLNDTGVDFFADASLVMIPEGYATGVVYGQRPLTSDSQLTFTRASTATRVNSSGLIETVASNVPRLDYLGATCGPRLLLEPQRSNVHLNSSNMWAMSEFNSGGAAVPTKSQELNITSPTGYNDAVVVTGGSGSVGSWGIYELIPTVINAGQQVTVSVFAKAGTNDFIHLANANISATGSLIAFFNLSNGTTPTAGARIENWGNGWYRCIMPTVTLTANTSASYNVGCYVTPSTSANNWSTDYTGKSVYLFGIQVEAGAYATSHIPTTTAAVTRLVDDCVKSSATSIIGQTEGVVYFEWEYQNVGSSGGSIPISLDSAGGDEIYFWVQTNGTYKFDVGDSGSSQVSITGSMGSFGTKKIALAYKNNDFALYINGVLAGTDTSGTVPTCNRLYVGRYYANTAYNIASGIKPKPYYSRPALLTNSSKPSPHYDLEEV